MQSADVVVIIMQIIKCRDCSSDCIHPHVLH